MQDVKSAIDSMLVGNGWIKNGLTYDSGSIICIRLSDKRDIPDEEYSFLSLRVGTAVSGTGVSGGPYVENDDDDKGAAIVSHIASRNYFPGSLDLYYNDANKNVVGVIKSGDYHQFFIFGESPTDCPDLEISIYLII
jgi:hypothetical protein